MLVWPGKLLLTG